LSLRGLDRKIGEHWSRAGAGCRSPPSDDGGHVCIDPPRL